MRASLATSLVCLLIVAGCGGADDTTPAPTASAAPTPGTRPSDTATPDDGATTVPAATRPEGEWTGVRTVLERSDSPDQVKGQASVGQFSLTPSCDEGPCDLVAAPAGVDGGYGPEGEAYAEGTPPAEPLTYTWHDADSTYTSVRERLGSCSTFDGTVTLDAYTVVTTTVVRYAPADGDRPAALLGTYDTVTEPTAAGIEAGCTPYSTTGDYVASPTDAEDISDLDLTGEYVVTETADVEPSGAVPRGFSQLFYNFTVDGVTFVGTTGAPAELRGSGGVLSGATDPRSDSCGTEPETPDAFTTIESYRDIRFAAFTADGAAILMGNWELESLPTQVGEDAGCEPYVQSGFLVMVPTSPDVPGIVPEGQSDAG